MRLTDHDGYSALFLAVIYGHVHFVKLLLGFGADPNALEAGGRGFSPLMAAAEAGHELVVHSLVKMGADVNYANVLGDNARSVAAKGSLGAMQEPLNRLISETFIISSSFHCKACSMVRRGLTIT